MWAIELSKSVAKEEKYEENKINFEGGNVLGEFGSNLELGVPHPKETCSQEFICFCSGSVELQMPENGVQSTIEYNSTG